MPQKATELGVSQIQLLTSERCEMRLKYDRDQKKLDHGKLLQLQHVNNGLNLVPEVLAPISLHEWLSSSELPQSKFVLAPEKNKKMYWREYSLNLPY